MQENHADWLKASVLGVPEIQVANFNMDMSDYQISRPPNSKPADCVNPMYAYCIDPV
jgi:hypothetical protein